MLGGGGFRAIAEPRPSIAELVYVRLKGGEPPGDEHAVAFEGGGSPDAAAALALARLTTLVTRFEDEATPYRSLVLSMWKHRYGTYDDLARVKEWSLAGGVEEGET